MPKENKHSDLSLPDDFEEVMDANAGRNRRQYASEVPLDPNVLAGSYFHKVVGGEIQLAGVVDGSVSTTTDLGDFFLCSIDQGLAGCPSVRPQIMVPAKWMLFGYEDTEFRFYDTEEDRTLAATLMTVAADREEA